MALEIKLDPTFEQTIKKLVQCQDSRTGTQSFDGYIRVSIVDGVATLENSDEVAWATVDSGEVVPLQNIRLREE